MTPRRGPFAPLGLPELRSSRTRGSRTARVLVAAGIGVGVLVVGIGVALALLDRAALSRFASERASLALGRAVQFGRVDLAYWPLGLRIRDVRVAGDAGSPALAEVDSIALGLAIGPLLRGRVELQALELERPRIVLPVGPDGWPSLAALIPASAQGAQPQPGRVGSPIGRDGAAEARGISLTIDRFAVRGGECTAGAWKLLELEAEGRLDARNAVTAAFSAVIGGIGTLADGSLRVEALGSERPRVQAQGTLREVELAALLQALPFAAIGDGVAAGRVSGPVSVELAGSQVSAARIELAASELELRAPSLVLAGAARAELVLGERFAIDLGGARLDVPGVLHKPAGERLVLSGELRPELSWAAPGRSVLALGRAEIPVSFALASDPPQLEIAAAELDLAALPRWLELWPGGIDGTLRSRGLRLAFAPLRADGDLDLERGSLRWQETSVEVSGPLHASGSRWSSESLAVVLAGQTLAVSAAYDVAARQLEAAARADGVDAGALFAALGSAPVVSGRLDGRIDVRGPPALAELTGSGEFSVRDGSLRGLTSAPESAAGHATEAHRKPAAVAAGAAGSEEPRFQELAGRFRVAAGGVELDSFSVRGGQWNAGPWRIRDIAADGTLTAARVASAVFSAALEGIGAIADGRVQVDDWRAATPRLRAQGVLRDGDVAGIFRALTEAPAAVLAGRGKLRGPFSVELDGTALRAAVADWSASDLDVHAGALQLAGAGALKLALGERFSLDLGAARALLPGVIDKPAGQRLVLAGPLGAELSAAALGAAVLSLGSVDLPLTLALAATPPHVEIGASALDLTALRGWLAAPPGEVEGTLRSGGLRVTFAPLRIAGELALDAASLPLGGGVLALTGNVQASGERLIAAGLAAERAGQTLAVTGEYDLGTGRLDASLRATSVDLEKLLAGFVDAPDVTGLISGQLEWSGPADLGALRGSGEFSIADGRIRGFSLLREFLGQYAALGAAVAQLRGIDLERFDEEQFTRLAGRFSLAPGRIDLEFLDLEYRYTSAALRGTIGLPEGALVLGGELLLRKEVGAELAGDARVEEEVIPLEGIGGTLARPRLILNKASMARLAARYAIRGPLGDKLEKKLGTEGSEALKRVLDGIRTRRERRGEPESDTRH